MLQGHADAADDYIAAAAHPLWAFVAHPYDLVHDVGIPRGRIVGSILETHQVARRLLRGRGGEEARLHPADLRHVISQPHQLAHGMEG